MSSSQPSLSSENRAAPGPRLPQVPGRTRKRCPRVNNVWVIDVLCVIGPSLLIKDCGIHPLFDPSCDNLPADAEAVRRRFEGGRGQMPGQPCFGGSDANN